MEQSVTPWKKYLLIGLSVVAALFIYEWISSPMVVSVTGVGSVSAPAESASVTFSLSSGGENPEVALNSVKATSEKIKTLLAEMGIPESDVFESQATVVPAATVVPGGSGFQATISMGLKTKNVSIMDRVITVLYSNGAAVVSQPVLTVQNKEEMEKESYDLAFKDAKSKAWSLQLSNFKFLKKIVLIQESQNQSTSTVTSKADTATQIEGNVSPNDGLIKVSKVVSVSYKMW
jgi:uncharacterized protein YggE